MAEHTGLEAPTSPKIRQMLQSPPPRGKRIVQAVSAHLYQRMRRWLMGSAAALATAGPLFLVLPPSEPGQLSNLLLVLPIFLCCGGVIGGLLGLYFASHLKVLRTLVRDHPVVTGVVEDTWRGARGAQGMRVRLDLDDGSSVHLYPEGQPFTALCKVGEALPCLYGTDRYGAAVLQNGVIAVGAWRRPPTSPRVRG